MKRFLSAVCILLIVFNSIEYYALGLLAQKQLTEQVLQKIETNSNELGGSLILAIPLEMPYLSDSREYTSVAGEFAYEGELYRMVKQKFYRDMLYVVCIKDDQSTKVHSAIADYSKLFSGERSGRTNSSIKMFNSLSKDYISKSHKVKHPSSISIRISTPEFSNLYGYHFTSSVFHPPQYS